jgi:DNA (cytosine-5)-methyltransferase 1
MVSILGDFYYEFPKTMKLGKRLKDVLETQVDSKYYLSDKIVDYFVKHTEECKEKGNGFKFEPTDGGGIAKAITTRAGSRMDDNFITPCDVK